MHNRLTKFYSRFLPILFILNGYGVSGFPIGLGSILLVCFVILSFLDRSKKIRSLDNLKPIGLFIFLFFISLLDFLFENSIEYTSVFSAFLKMLIWACSVSVLASAYLDISLFKEHYRIFCNVCTIYLFAQNIIWRLFRVFIPNLYTIGPIHPLYEQYSQGTLQQYIISTNLTRFGSFFSEPAFYGHMMLANIILILFCRDNERLVRRDIIELAFISLGILLSTSTGAIVLLMLIYILFGLMKKGVKYFVILGSSAIALFYLFSHSPFKDNNIVQFFLYKMTHMSTSGRIGVSFSNILKLTNRQLIMGIGIGNTSMIADGYLNSFASIIISFGLIGFVAFLLFSGSYFVKGGPLIKVLMTIYVLGSFQGAIAFSIHGVLYLSLVMAMLEQHDKLYERNSNTESSHKSKLDKVLIDQRRDIITINE